MDRNAEDWLNAGSLSRSLSARRAWIEMREKFGLLLLTSVALRKESVDRNSSHAAKSRETLVALRKESVDRNCPGTNTTLSTTVALRKESVDRNLDTM